MDGARALSRASRGTAPEKTKRGTASSRRVDGHRRAEGERFSAPPDLRWAHDQARRCATGARGQIRNPAASHLPWQGPTLRPKSRDRGLTGFARFHLVNHAVDKVGGSFALAPRWGGQK